jgi:hypothetical protein
MYLIDVRRRLDAKLGEVFREPVARTSMALVAKKR